MAVYDRNFGIYQGARTPTWSRFLILPRYAYQEVFQSRLFVAFLGFCFLMPFAGLLIIYLHHNLAALKFNTAIAGLMEYVNEIMKRGATREDLVTLAKLLGPFAPHLADYDGRSPAPAAAPAAAAGAPRDRAAAPAGAATDALRDSTAGAPAGSAAGNGLNSAETIPEPTAIGLLLLAATGFAIVAVRRTR